jgi:hypothetical protein
MDLAVLITGLAVSVCQALGRDGTHVFIASLEDMASRPNLKPAEAEIFRSVGSALNIGLNGHRATKFTVIKGGAA